MHEFLHAVHTANIDIATTIPWNRTPEKTDGTCIFAEVFTVPCGAHVLVRFLAHGLHKTADAALVACLFIDDQQYAVRTSAQNPKGPGYFVPLPLEYCHVPGDGLPHTYRIHVGPIPVAVGPSVMAINGMSGNATFGATMAATLTLEEK